MRQKAYQPTNNDLLLIAAFFHIRANIFLRLLQLIHPGEGKSRIWLLQTD